MAQVHSTRSFDDLELVDQTTMVVGGLYGLMLSQPLENFIESPLLSLFTGSICSLFYVFGARFVGGFFNRKVRWVVPGLMAAAMIAKVYEFSKFN